MFFVIQHPIAILKVLSSSTAIAVPLPRWGRLITCILCHGHHIAVSKINNNLPFYIPSRYVARMGCTSPVLAAGTAG